MIRLNTLKISLILFFLNNIAIAQNLRVDIKTYQLPILADQSINVIKRYVIHSDIALYNQKIELPITIDKFNNQIVKQIELWQSNTDTTLLKDGNKEKFEKLQSQVFQKAKTNLMAVTNIKKGANYFWLSVQVPPVKNLLTPLDISYDALKLNGKKIKFQDLKSSSHRYAVAVRRHKQDRVHTSRIPGIITAKDGSLVSVYDARYESGRDLQGHMDIGVSRSLDGGHSWLPFEVAIDMGEFGGLGQKWNGVSDPNIIINENNGEIFVAGLWMHGVIDETGTWYPGIKDGKEIWNHQWKTKGSQPGFGIKETSQFLMVRSQDNGKTWSKPINLTEMCKKEDWWLWAPAPGHGLTMKNGTLVMPTQGRDNSGKAFSNITYSKDGGKTWLTSNPALPRSTTECMAVELEDGRIMLNMRSNLNSTEKGEKNGRAVATTNDMGKTWIEHPTSHHALIEPTCMASIHKHHYSESGNEKTLLVFCNPNSKYERVNISLKISKDNGNTWITKTLLDEGKGRGYSCITSIDKNTIGILYESSQADLVFQQVSLKELL
ncbi:sialidase family protein [Sphingobacterium sp. 1.A.4]|uniref:sialidase family protein n=1 Tax=Sphingobacterium sp. 1.A.4 TaxID=2044603 RepID=UPI000C0BE9A7|nr:sialidase family protein [Sphingobacterium sp. 1.A.4]